MTPSVFIDGIDAATLGAVVDLKFTRAFGGGEGGGLRDVAFELGLDPLFQHPALRLNAPVEVRHGAESLGEARIVAIDRGTWEIQADGIVRLGEDYECRAADSSPSSLAVGLPLAIGRGLPWEIDPALTLPTDVPESMQTVSQALNEWAASSGKSWLLDGRVLRMVSAPTTPTLLLRATDNPNSSTDGVVSSVTAKYAGAVDEHGNPALISYVTETLDDAPKHVERTIDLTGEGALWEADARARAKAELVGGSQSTLTESVAVAKGTLTTAAGHDLSDVLCTVREGQVLRQLDWVNPDGSPGLYRDWVIGGVDWSLDDGLVLTPLGADAATLGGAIIDMRKGIEDAQDAADEAQETVAEVRGGLQEAYDRADRAAADAAAAAATGTAAMTAANGKNKVTWSASGPGATPNTAGDIWWQRSGGVIAGQWVGLGGTSWQSQTVAGSVIAYLDAGQLTAGSAFVNGLYVKTNFTLGDASTNGVIQSYNFAGSPVGVYIDKFGLVAKGGSLTSATITASTMTSSTYSTAPAFAGGPYVTLSTGGLTWSGAGASGMYFTGTGLVTPGGSFGLTDTSSNPVMLLSTSSCTFYPSVTFNSNVTFNGTNNFGSFNGLFNGTHNGSWTGSLVASGEIHAGSSFFDDSLSGGGGTGANINNNGKIIRTPPSSRKFKTDIEPLDLGDSVLSIEGVSWVYKDTEKHGAGRQVGLIAEDLVDAGLGQFITRDSKGEITGIQYDRLIVTVLPVLRRLAARIEVLEAAL